MDNLLSTEVLAGVLVGLLVLVIGLVGLQIWSSLQLRRMSKTAYQDDVRQAQYQATDILNEAQLEAQEVLATANEAGAKTMAEAGKRAQKTNETYQAELHELIDRYYDALGKTIKRGDESFAAITDAAADSFNRRQEQLNNQFDDVLESLLNVSKTLNAESTGAMTALNQSIENTSKTIELMMQEGNKLVQERVEKHLETLLDRAEADVNEYRQARFKLLDRYIERLVEDISVRVLHKKLTLDEHGELAQQALRDAKEHNVI